MSISRKFTGILNPVTAAACIVVALLMVIGAIYLMTGRESEDSSTSLQWKQLDSSGRIALLMESPQSAVHGLYEGGVREGLGDSISKAVYALLQKGQAEAALSLLSAGTELLPNDPDILGIRGVVAAIAGEQEAALVLLENAFVWNQDNPLVNYNLGNLLAQSGEAADRIRGKYLLMQVLESDDTDLIERAGLTLLANPGVPLLGNEIETVYGKLDSLSVFRLDNPRLSKAGRLAVEKRLQDGEKTEGQLVFVVNSGDAAMPEDWDTAFQEARDNDRFHEIKDLSMLALENNHEEQAYQGLYYVFMAGVPLEMQELLELFRLSKVYGSLSGTVRVAEGLSRVDPEDTSLSNEYIYFRLLAGEGVDEALKRARQLMKKYPECQSCQIILALGLLKTGRIKEAGKLMDSRLIDFSQMGNRGRLIHAVVLSATGQDVVADGLRELIDETSLLPAEAELLEAF